MAFSVDLDFNVRCPQFKWDDKAKDTPMWGLNGGQGRPWTDGSRLPTSATQIDKKKLYDVFPMPGLNAVSAKFKAIIEAFDPGVHQFFPITLKAKDGTPYPEEYFIFRACRTLNAVLADESPDLQWSKKQGRGFEGMPFVGGSGEKTVVSKAAIGDCPVWSSDLVWQGRLFFSNSLKKEMDKQKVRYVDYRVAEEVDRPFVLEEQIRPTIDWLLANKPDWVRERHPEWLTL